MLTKEFLASLPLAAFCNSNIWLVFDPEKKLPAAQIHFPIDSQVITYRQDGSARIVLEEVYHVSQTSKIIVLPYGTWTQDRNLSVAVAPLEERRKDLQGSVLRGQTLPDLPYSSPAMEGNLVTHVGGIIGEGYLVL